MLLPLDSLLLLTFAPFIGSFLSVLAVRLPAGEDVVASRSRCRACKTTLTPLELIPIVSWALLRGRCKTCGAKIDLLYPALEAGAIVVVLWAVLVGMEGSVLWVTAALGWTLLALAAMDLRAFILADVLTLPLVAFGLVVIAWWYPNVLMWNMAGAAAGFAVIAGAAFAYQAVRGKEGIGFGDAKLMAAAGAWTGLEGVGTVLLYGSLISLALVAVLRISGRQIAADTPIPLGAGIAAGFWLTWLYGPLLLAT